MNTLMTLMLVKVWQTHAGHAHTPLVRVYVDTTSLEGNWAESIIT